jgi:hypothetical protein
MLTGKKESWLYATYFRVLQTNYLESSIFLPADVVVSHLIQNLYSFPFTIRTSNEKCVKIYNIIQWHPLYSFHVDVHS